MQDKLWPVEIVEDSPYDPTNARIRVDGEADGLASPWERSKEAVMPYVDGFVIPVRNDRKEAYRKLAAMAADVFKEHGASRVVEAWADDVPEGKVTSFPMAVKLEAGRDRRLLLDRMAVARGPRRRQRQGDGRPAHADGRRGEPFSMERMIFGGFGPIVDVLSRPGTPDRRLAGGGEGRR